MNFTLKLDGTLKASKQSQSSSGAMNFSYAQSSMSFTVNSSETYAVDEHGAIIGFQELNGIEKVVNDPRLAMFKENKIQEFKILHSIDNSLASIRKNLSYFDANGLNVNGGLKFKNGDSEKIFMIPDNKSLKEALDEIQAAVSELHSKIPAEIKTRLEKIESEAAENNAAPKAKL